VAIPLFREVRIPGGVQPFRGILPQFREIRHRFREAHLQFSGAPLHAPVRQHHRGEAHLPKVHLLPGLHLLHHHVQEEDKFRIRELIRSK
jgi:hypothetical protein